MYAHAKRDPSPERGRRQTSPVSEPTAAWPVPSLSNVAGQTLWYRPIEAELSVRLSPEEWPERLQVNQLSGVGTYRVRPQPDWAPETAPDPRGGASRGILANISQLLRRLDPGESAASPTQGGDRRPDTLPQKRALIVKCLRPKVRGPEEDPDLLRAAHSFTSGFSGLATPDSAGYLRGTPEFARLCSIIETSGGSAAKVTESAEAMLVMQDFPGGPLGWLPGAQTKSVLRPEVLYRLGRLIASDAILGNDDRFIRAINPDSLIVGTGGVFAIDNTFDTRREKRDETMRALLDGKVAERVAVCLSTCVGEAEGQEGATRFLRHALPHIKRGVFCALREVRDVLPSRLLRFYAREGEVGDPDVSALLLDALRDARRTVRRDTTSSVWEGEERGPSRDPEAEPMMSDEWVVVRGRSAWYSD